MERICRFGPDDPIITGDPITAERKNKDVFVFRPFVKLILSCNNLPYSTDRSHGYFRRWIILPFPLIFPTEKWDRERAKRIIQTELSGVLNWAIGGYKYLKDAGHFTEPSSSKEALEEYKRETDPVIDFVEEHVTVFEDNSPITLLKDVYSTYRHWAKDNGYEPLGNTNFRKAIERVTGKVSHKTEYGRGFRGITLL
ncbi:MAG: phage/plasmid primase, P4 family [Desulfomonilaceae bacterium]